jgi:hypothetical protein
MFPRLTVIAAFALICGCDKATDRPNGPPDQGNSKGAKVNPMGRPFMEHPSGKFKTAVDAMADAIERLRGLPKWDSWITFQAQGMGGRVDSYHFATIRMLQGDMTFEKPIDIDIPAVTKRADVPESCLSKTSGGYTVANATPAQAARIMDVIYRDYLGIRPHEGEGDDYAVGAEW